MDIVISSASHHAMLFAYIAKAVIDKYGEKGREVISKGVNLYGWQRGRRMALRALADGKELNVENYLLYGEWEAFPGQMDLRFPSYSPEVRMQNYRCPWHTEWSQRGLLEYGYLYCKDVDAALARGFNGMDLQLKGNRSLGDECCDFVFKDNGIPEEKMEEFYKNQKKIGNKAKMPWPYHVGHLYSAMREVILEAFGSEGQKALEEALDEYKKEYGKAAYDLVLEYADLDYNVLPDYEGIEG
ncbi:L-2-amino-thiazoline-4-carboxylic acid hydrolase [Kallipyga gabonensis]|uniref:L-2-amino-thiazoline-4-carboxylic acid hydrolase n=1 Tax=Kallipyga gabonensis TaxID=1686287 RepID=UPI0006B47483|nr:L-2-amino-thiazoline-4-carboxylic acid hydrolase [Kallipyga gabonensis]